MAYITSCLSEIWKQIFKATHSSLIWISFAYFFHFLFLTVRADRNCTFLTESLHGLHSFLPLWIWKQTSRPPTHVSFGFLLHIFSISFSLSSFKWLGKTEHRYGEHHSNLSLGHELAHQMDSVIQAWQQKNIPATGQYFCIPVSPPAPSPSKMKFPMLK